MMAPDKTKDEPNHAFSQSGTCHASTQTTKTTSCSSQKTDQDMQAAANEATMTMTTSAAASVSTTNDNSCHVTTNNNNNGGCVEPTASASSSLSSPFVYLDLAIDNEPKGRVIIELYSSKLPKTTENFRRLCVGHTTDDGRFLSYKGSIFHRVRSKFGIQGGDFINGDGTGSESIYGKTFDDEGFEFKHSKPGLLTMANYGPNTNGSQFFITTVDCPNLDGKHVVFGEVKKGLRTIFEIEELPTDNGTISSRRKKSCRTLIADISQKFLPSHRLCCSGKLTEFEVRTQKAHRKLQKSFLTENKLIF